MKNSAVVFKEIMREYEKDRLNADNLLKSRLNEVYFAIPEIKQIDKELTACGIEITKAVLLSKDSSESFVAEMESKNAALIKRKYELLRQRSFGDDYLTNVHKCMKCKDTGFVNHERCICMKRRLIHKYYEISNLNNVLQKENFDTFDLDYYDDAINPRLGMSPRANMRRIYLICSNFTKNFDSNFSNLMLYGNTALGKTFLCNCIAKELLDIGKNVIYLTAPQLFKRLEELRFNRKENEDNFDYLDNILEADLLIIDDLGTEFLTSMTATELFNIINTRMLDRKQVIISTNMSPSDFESRYSDRVTSRIIGNYILLHLVGDDIRLKKRYTM